METVVIEGVTLHLCRPDVFPLDWVGQPDLIDQVLAAWLVVEEKDLPCIPVLWANPVWAKPPWPMPPPAA